MLPVGRGTGSGGHGSVSLVEEPNEHIYRCENVEIDAALGCLKRGGEEQHLRQQSLHVLLYLVERRHHVISKEELIEKFWPETAVTDNALVQCVAEIRRALGDDPRDPRFVRTIPKTGYRFIADVIDVRPAAEPSAPAPVAPVESGHAFPRSGVRYWLSLALLLGMVSLAVWLAVRHSWPERSDPTLAPGPGEKSIAIMYFENQGAKEDLNWLREGLADMFITDLAHFSQLRVLSRQQLHLLMLKNGHGSDREIQLSDALELARKSHAEEILMGSFLALGEKLLVSVRLFDARNGQLVTAEQFVVDRPADILAQVDLLSPRLAARLGVKPSQTIKQTSLAQTMTDSVEAYRYYSLGVSKAQSFQNSEALALLRKAIQLDPNFAMAYARIGYAYSVTDFLPEKGRPYLAKAIQLSDRLTAKDRLSVSAWYAIAQQDYAGAIRILTQLITEYPGEIEAYTRLARLQYREENPREAIAIVQRGLKVDSESGDLYNVLGMCFLGLGRYEEAIAAHERYLQLSPNEPNAHDSLGMSFQQSGRYEKALTEYNSALSLDPEFEPAMIHLGDTYAQQGRYREAIAQYRRYVTITRSDMGRAVGLRNIAELYRRLGNVRGAEQAERSEAGYAKGKALVALERGSRDELRSNDYHAGARALQTGHVDLAISHFREALRHLPPSSGLDLYEDCLGNAFLEAGRLDEAIGEYERILKANPNYPLAQYHLAQAYQRKGASVASRAAYGKFLQTWKSADEDIPEVIDARKQLLAL